MKKSLLKIVFVTVLVPIGVFADMGHNMKQHDMSKMGDMGNMSGNMSHSHNAGFKESSLVKEFKKPLLLPPMLKGELKNGVREFNLDVTSGQWEFLDGKMTKTYGYNGPILGPVLVINRDEKVKININNKLPELTTIHWHGGILSEDVDGVLNSDIQEGKSKAVEFVLSQPSAMLWFHPHPMHKTASQVYKGLAGIIYLEDKTSAKLKIPKTYGSDDFPVVIQDKIIDDDGNLTYQTTDMEKLHGKSGGYLMINGVISPYVDVPNGFTRLRLLNGSNATNYDINFAGKNFFQISSDGGFLKSPIKMDKISLAPGERAGILIDSRDLDKISYMFVNNKKALELRKNNKKALKSIPKKLESVPNLPKGLESLPVRKFTLKTQDNKNTINNTLYDMSKVNFDVIKGTQEIWEIKNGSDTMDMPHPFHVHGAQFKIIQKNGKTPPPNEQGWKDTVNLKAGDSVKILITYKTDGISVYHCHILEHEEGGMMGQFKVQQ